VTMNFRKLLFELSELEAKEFTSSEVATHLGHTVKVTSNDLRRLHSMGFLKRKRKKRLCLAENSKWCYKGFEYWYSISNQGKSYLKWMKKQKPLEDIVHIKLAKEVLSHLPKELKEKLFLKAVIKSTYKYNGPSSHFKLIRPYLHLASHLMSSNFFISFTSLIFVLPTCRILVSDLY